MEANNNETTYCTEPTYIYVNINRSIQNIVGFVSLVSKEISALC